MWFVLPKSTISIKVSCKNSMKQKNLLSYKAGNAISCENSEYFSTKQLSLINNFTLLLRYRN